MRQVTFTKLQFRNFIYPQIGKGTSKGEGDWEAAIRLVKVLKDDELTEEIPYNEAEREALAKGEMIYPFRTLIEDSATFLFQDDEFRFLETKMKADRPKVPLLAGEDYDSLLQALKDAEKIEKKAEQKKPELVDEIKERKA